MGSRLDANSSAVRKKIEKHRFDNENGEEYESSKFGGFTDYFRRKKIKLQNLDAELRSSSSENPQIFRGVVAHVNGYTQPSLNDLHSLIVTHGGGFLQYLDGKTMVTHIIASNLTPKKKIEFRRYRIVKPAWVVDSVEAGRLLPWDGYRVLEEGVGQQILGFDNGSVVSQANSQYGGYRDQTEKSWYTEQIKSLASEIDDAAAKEPISSDQILPNDGRIVPDSEEQSTQEELEGQHLAKPQSRAKSHSPDTADLEHMINLKDTDNFSPRHISSNDTAIATPSPEMTPMVGDILSTNDAIFEKDSRTYRRNSSIGLVSQKENVHKPDEDKAAKKAKKSEMMAEDHNAILLADPKKWKSTAVNPDFLKQYYEESRLHHLSTWKAELKSQLQALAAEKTSSQKAREKRPAGSRRYILHVDFDCFFAAVSLRKHPEYIDKPVAIAHGGGSGSEIASCNYPAREFGVKNGMWMKSAQALCPDLKVLPYNFKAYEEASRYFYEAIIDTGGIVQSVSIDEALVDISNECAAAGGSDGRSLQEGNIWREQAKADEVAQGLRETIKAKTGCAVSVGIGGNILLAKVALRKAKPAGQHHVKPDEVLDFVGSLLVQDLPGVAHSIGGKLEEIGVRFVKDVRELSKERLIAALGPKTGEKIYDYSRGIDRVEVGEQVTRKSVSAEVNWGIRFVTQEQAEEFVQSLCDELHKRLVSEKVKGRQLTLKIMRRAADAPLDPPKHLGHGKCDTYNKSIMLGVATNDKQILGREAISIMRGWGFPPGELRGIGAQVQKLEPLKGSVESPVASSQKRLQFKTPDSRMSLTRREGSIEDLESPQKPLAVHPHEAASFATDNSPSGKPRQPLNTLGTQFVLPTQADPEVLAELPDDIRSHFVPQRPLKIPFPPTEEGSAGRSRSNVSTLPSDALPSQSQLDPDTLNALPNDVRAEILAFYNTSPPKPQVQGILPQSPHKARSHHPPVKKTTTPTKKRVGLLPRGRPPGSKNAPKNRSHSGFTQSNFVAHRALGLHPPDAAAPTATSDVSPEFLSALPEDIRREVVDQARRDRLQQKGGIDLVTKKAHRLKRPAPLPPGQRHLTLPPRPPRPTFTAQKWSELPDLREAVSEWFAESKDDGPHGDDVEALVRYLKRVVGDEEDMSKAVRVVQWLRWLMRDAAEFTGMSGWETAAARIADGVQEAVRERGLGAVVF